MLPESIGVVGQGAVGRFLSQRLGARVVGRNETPPADLSLIFLAVPDQAIAAVAARLRPLSDAALVHCSGATPRSALGEGPGAVWHPMAAFGRGEPAQDLGGAVVGLRGDEDLLAPLERIARQLGGGAARVDEDEAVRVHAACCFAAGFCATVAGIAAQQLGRAGLSPAQAATAVTGLSDSAIAAVLGGRGLTGPALRGDRATMEAHREALPELQPLYDALTEAMLALSEQA